MKKFFIILTALVFFTIGSVQAYNYKNITDDSRILAALQVLEKTESFNTLNALYKNKNKPIQIIFYDLGMISFEYKNHFAMTSNDNFGDDYIIIHTKYRNAPKEALAALIAHEAVHTMQQADLTEEVEATIAELNQWQKALALNPNLDTNLNSENLLIKRLNNLLNEYKTNGTEGISKRITSNSFYEVHLLQNK